MFNWLKKKPEEKPEPTLVIVHTPDGTSFGHMAVYRTIKNNGTLCLHDGMDGARVVADYTAGSWTSLSIGDREVVK